VSARRTVHVILGSNADRLDSGLLAHDMLGRGVLNSLGNDGRA